MSVKFDPSKIRFNSILIDSKHQNKVDYAIILPIIKYGTSGADISLYDQNVLIVDEDKTNNTLKPMIYKNENNEFFTFNTKNIRTLVTECFLKYNLKINTLTDNIIYCDTIPDGMYNETISRIAIFIIEITDIKIGDSLLKSINISELFKQYNEGIITLENKINKFKTDLREYTTSLIQNAEIFNSNLKNQIIDTLIKNFKSDLQDKSNQKLINNVDQLELIKENANNETIKKLFSSIKDFSTELINDNLFKLNDKAQIFEYECESYRNSKVKKYKYNADDLKLFIKSKNLQFLKGLKQENKKYNLNQVYKLQGGKKLKKISKRKVSKKTSKRKVSKKKVSKKTSKKERYQKKLDINY